MGQGAAQPLLLAAHGALLPLLLLLHQTAAAPPPPSASDCRDDYKGECKSCNEQFYVKGGKCVAVSASCQALPQGMQPRAAGPSFEASSASRTCTPRQTMHTCPPACSPPPCCPHPPQCNPGCSSFPCFDPEGCSWSTGQPMYETCDARGACVACDSDYGRVGDECKKCQVRGGGSWQGSGWGVEPGDCCVAPEGGRLTAASRPLRRPHHPPPSGGALHQVRWRCGHLQRVRLLFRLRGIERGVQGAAGSRGARGGRRGGTRRRRAAAAEEEPPACLPAPSLLHRVPCTPSAPLPPSDVPQPGQLHLRGVPGAQAVHRLRRWSGRAVHRMRARLGRRQRHLVSPVGCSLSLWEGKGRTLQLLGRPPADPPPALPPATCLPALQRQVRGGGVRGLQRRRGGLPALHADRGQLRGELLVRRAHAVVRQDQGGARLLSAGHWGCSRGLRQCTRPASFPVLLLQLQPCTASSLFTLSR